MALTFEEATILALSFDLPAIAGAHRSLLPSATEIGLLIRGAAGQSADLLQLQDALGTSLVGFDASGSLRLGSNFAFSGVAYPSSRTLTVSQAGDGNDANVVIQKKDIGNPRLLVIADPAHGGRSFAFVSMIDENSLGGGKLVISDDSVYDDMPPGGVIQASRIALDKLGHIGINLPIPYAVLDVAGNATVGVSGAPVWAPPPSDTAFIIRVQGSVKASADGNILRGLYVLPTFQDDGHSGVIHRALEVVGNVLLGDTSDEIGFYGVPPVTRQLLATGASHTVDDVIAALQALGLVRQS